MRELKKKKYWGLLSLLLFLVAIAIGYFVILPLVGDLKDLNIKVAAKDQENTKLTAKISALSKLSQSMSSSPDKVNLLDLAIPNDDMPAEIIASLSSMASSSGMTISSISESKSTESDFTPVSIVFESSYNGLKLFLQSLEGNIRFVRVKNLNLSRSVKSDGGEGFVSGSMNLDMFKYTGAVVSQTTSAPEEVTQ